MDKTFREQQKTLLWPKSEQQMTLYDPLSSDIDEAMLKCELFRLRMTQYEYLVVKLLCRKDSFENFKMRHSRQEDSKSRSMSLHKSIVTLVVTLAFAFTVNYFEEYQFVFKILEKEKCMSIGVCTE